MTDKLIESVIKMNLPGSAYKLILALSLKDNYNSELARLTGMNREQSYKVLKHLKDMDIVETYQVGKNVFYTLKLANKGGEQK
ncbi:MAG TPA: hypothetical protein VM577_07955 [Anaerovoracaceae bacterium]|nr:hypothetical protein [Anaerovoracaceae bacterium]